MIIQTTNIKYNVDYFPSQNTHAPIIFFLHGFTGSSKDWEEVIPQLDKKFSCAAVDLIGHGKSDSPVNIELYTAEFIIQQLNEIFTYFTKEKFILIGYSMGGRAALSYAVHYSEKLAGLVLESASAGISDKKLREERVRSDEEIIKMIEEKSLQEFAEFWMKQDLFESLKKIPTKKLEKIQKSKIKNQKIGLINSLKGFGTGVMTPLYDKLHLVKCRTLLISGEIDKKFSQINSEMLKSFPDAEHIVIKNAGHNVHFEKPEDYGLIINDMFN